MSLRVNLILPEEQRSGSALNKRSLIRIGGITVPLLLLLGVSQQTLSRFVLKSQIGVLESQWFALEPKQKQAIRQLARLNFNLQTKKELDGWTSTRPVCSRMLVSIMEAVPDTIQLTSLRMSAIAPNTQAATPPAPLRTVTITLDGITGVTDSMQAVETLEHNLKTNLWLAPFLESIRVVNFAAASSATDERSRIFSIVSNFKPLPLKETP